MHRLFGNDVGGSDPWRHLMVDDTFNRDACARLINDYISEDEVVVFIDSRHAVHCRKDEAPPHIESFMKIRRVKVANLAFTAKVVVDPIGVGQGSKRANQSLHPIQASSAGSVG
ncbi:hypothetical protein [Paucibacter sp. Y2R2-4]|uniref:hypothetical protein n=1 Tax=Paucibacter sp. Y2R2-4 TaxID=2893553 RepID=UPI0021E379C1|nr:hypothetical protein [Paucibacter sp. Y2R2-4]MCV2351115.1 hypothetical protein [Paucibacter sp. Y2R2-4]